MNKNMILYFAMILATIFVAIFVAAFVKDLNDPNYDIPPGLYPLLTVIVGGIFGYVAKRSAND